MHASWPAAFLGASVLFLAASLNVLRPVRRPAVPATLSFFAGWLVGELAYHHLAAQVLVAIAFVLVGGLAAWPGYLALGLCVVAWALLRRGYDRARSTRVVLDDALRDGLGDHYDDAIPPERLAALDANPDWKAIVRPFPIGHPDVVRTRDVVFHAEGRLRLRLDVFRHKSQPANAPTLVYVHGGGWVIGRRGEQGLPLLYHLASLGWTCFSIDYRLSPRATFPDHLVDVKRAIHWVREHAAEHGVDPDFIVVSGNSAGGHLASLAALTAGDPEYQPGFEGARTDVAGCVSFYWVYDFVDRFKTWPHGGMRMVLRDYVLKAPLESAREVWERASPISRIGFQAPPFLVIHGDLDTLVPVAQARHFVEAFRQNATAPICYAEIPGAQHAFEIFPSLRTELTIRAVARYCAWLHATQAARTSPDDTTARPPQSAAN